MIPDIDAEIVFKDEGGLTLAPASAAVTVSPVRVDDSELLDETDPNARMNKIVGLVNDPDSPMADISRLIALEIASIIAMMNEHDPARRHNRSFKDLNDHVKALRELQRTLTEADSLSKKDVLNLDGPKFKYIYTKLLEFFRKSMKDANIDDALAKQVMLAFGDMIKENDESIRRELNKIEIGR